MKNKINPLTWKNVENDQHSNDTRSSESALLRELVD